MRDRRKTIVRKGPIRGLALRVRNLLLAARLAYFRKVLKMDLDPGCKISLKANLDRTNPTGVHIGEGTYVAFGVVVLAHDMSRAIHVDTWIGRNCFVGAHAIIMPGVRIGDECIIGAGSVVTKDVPSHSIVGGNPARVLKSDISTVRWGIMAEDYARAYDESLRRSLEQDSADLGR
jgi:acetyltransferase-like isoleucine patch superfamily enzyme